MRNGRPWHLRGADIFTVRNGKVAAKLAIVAGVALFGLANEGNGTPRNAFPSPRQLEGPIRPSEAAVGPLQKVFPYSPTEVFASAVRVVQGFSFPLESWVDWKEKVIHLWGVAPDFSGSEHLTLSFGGVPDGRGAGKPCTATRVLVKGYRLTVEGARPTRESLRVGDVIPVFSQLQKALDQSRGSIRALTMETGPFAAAELHTWVPDNTRHFVIVEVEYKAHPGIVMCAPYTAALRTDSGKEYPPGAGIPSSETGVTISIAHLGPPGVVPYSQPGVSERSYASYDVVRTYDFAVGPTDRPKTLDLKPASDAQAACDAKFGGGGWELLTVPSEVSLPLAGLPMPNDLTTFDQGGPPLRFGQLRVRVTAVATTSEPDYGPFREFVPHGRYILLVALGLQNVSRNPNCTDFNLLPGRLITDKRYNVSGYWASPPRMRDLMPGETSGGTLVFAPYQGSKPV